MKIIVSRSKLMRFFGSCTFLLLFLFNYTYFPSAYAAVINNPKDILTRETISINASHLITFTTPSGVDSGDTITLNFESDFDIASVVVGDVMIGGNAPASVTVVGRLMTITSDADTIVTAGNTATIAINNNHITNPSIPGDYFINFGGTFGDSGVIAIPIVGNDQISITGDIANSITFALSTSTCTLGTLTTGSVSSCGPFTYTVGTTANMGYTVTIQDNGDGSTAGLYKESVKTDLIVSSTANLIAGTEGYGVQGAVDTGTQTIAPTYLKTTNGVGGLNRTPTTISSYNGATAVNQITSVTVKAAISPGTVAGTYGDTLTFLATGNF